MDTCQQDARISELESRVADLEEFIMTSLVFRLEDLADSLVAGTATPGAHAEILADIRRVADKARSDGWCDGVDEADQRP